MSSPARAVVMNEWSRGERGQEGDIHIGGLRGTGETMTQGMMAFQRGVDRHMEDQTTVVALERLDELFASHGHDGIIVAAWGGLEAELALEEFAAQRRHTSREDTMPVISALRIEHDQVWENTRITHGPDASRWDHIGALPDVSEEMIPRGYKPPAQSPGARIATLQPAVEPLASLDPRAAETIAGIKPSARIDKGIECVDALTYAAAEGLEEPHLRASEIQVLSDCVASDPVVRDSVAVYVAEHQGRTASLIDAYRHAPIENREAMSACAASANALGGGSSEATEILGQPASLSSEHSGLAGMVSYTASRGMAPAEINDRIVGNLPEAIQQADASFTRERDQRLAIQTTPLNSSGPTGSGHRGPGL